MATSKRQSSSPTPNERKFAKKTHLFGRNESSSLEAATQTEFEPDKPSYMTISDMLGTLETLRLQMRQSSLQLFEAEENFEAISKIKSGLLYLRINFAEQIKMSAYSLVLGILEEQAKDVAAAAAESRNKTQGKTPGKQNYKSMVIKTPDADLFMKNTKKKISPINLNVRIPVMVKLNENTVLVKSPTAKEIIKFKIALKQIFKDDIKIITNDRIPEIVIHNVQDLTEADISQGIENITQETPQKIKLVTTHYNKVRAYLKVSPTLLKRLEAEDPKIVILGYRRCPYFGHIAVLQCFKCCKFGHTARACTTLSTELNVIGTLKSEGICSNCFLAEFWNRLKDKPELDTADFKEITNEITHNVFDRTCPMYLKVRSVMKRRYSYD